MNPSSKTQEPQAISPRTKALLAHLTNIEETNRQAQDDLKQQLTQAITTQIQALNTRIQHLEATEELDQHDITLDEDEDDRRSTTSSKISTVVTGNREKTIFSECKRTFAPAMLFDGKTDTSPDATGPYLHEFELLIYPLLESFDLMNAAQGHDTDPENLRLSAYLIRQGLSPRLKAVMAQQTYVNSNGHRMWAYLNEVYGRCGIAGMLRCMQSCHAISPKAPSPDAIRDHVNNCQSLWLLTEKQLCPHTTWGSKLAMLFAGLEHPWCSRFRASLIDELETLAAQQARKNKAHPAAIGKPQTTDQQGEQLIEHAIRQMHRFLGSEEAAQATRALTQVKNTPTLDQKPNSAQKDQKQKRPSLSQLPYEERRKYYMNETPDQKERRLARRKGSTCTKCKGKDHFACDPECPQNPGYASATPPAPANINVIDTPYHEEVTDSDSD